ncbi:hypothetical protein AOQ84DRAFT_293338 [Glonium stellatum]|uniref:C3H1-type domain-containing protein n=1 Tax=Glonium stellatum TaxID=574774 RepID=A0A8E2F0K8_9PEZI|nr:hypothetical protein AOQ84DRAFT_293338 [Glonium stellatum]
MPKHFTTPVACYYWARGRCVFSDEDCQYAHWDTGNTASAPILLSGSTQAVAGRAAERQLRLPDEEAVREKVKELETWEKNLLVRKDLLRLREEALDHRERGLVAREEDVAAREREVWRRERGL